MQKLLTALSLFVVSVFGPAATTAQPNPEIGRLVCMLGKSTNLVLISKQELDCSFDRLGGAKEPYVARIQRIGVDLSIKKDAVIVWTVVLLADAEEPVSIDGTYVGASADAALGVGAGRRVLVGKGENAVSLKPLSITGVQGGGASLGIEQFVLTAKE